MKWLHRLLTRRREKRDARWRREVYAARPPGVLYITEQWFDLDPTIIFIPEEKPKWLN
jgi:hypothetical protein